MLWKLDVAHTNDGIRDGFVYGEAPAGTTQTFPTTGAPVALESGKQYYVYVLKDIAIPITRCLFNYESDGAWTDGVDTTDDVSENESPWNATCANDDDCRNPTVSFNHSRDLIQFLN